MTCGNGKRSRSREIIVGPVNNGKPCPATVESSDCKLEPCPGKYTIVNLGFSFINITFFCTTNIVYLIIQRIHYKIGNEREILKPGTRIAGYRMGPSKPQGKLLQHLERLSISIQR